MTIVLGQIAWANHVAQRHEFSAVDAAHALRGDQDSYAVWQASDSTSS